MKVISALEGEKRKIVVGITGASGSIYAHRFITKLLSIENQFEEMAVILSETAKKVWAYELKDNFPKSNKIIEFSNDNLFAPPASGSAGYDAMVVIPCSMGSLGKIANGISDSLLTRSADVMLKERRAILLVTRELPYSLIHLENMRTVTLAGGIVVPASPSFYSKPETIEELVDSVVDRVIGVLGFKIESYTWKGNNT